MKEIVASLSYAIAGLGGFLSWLLGGMDGFLCTLIAFSVVDYTTSVMLAVIEKRLTSKIGFQGIFKKLFVFCMVIMSHILDTQIIKGSSVLRTAVIFFYLSIEGISILENAVKIGLPVPQKLKDILEQLKNERKK